MKEINDQLIGKYPFDDGVRINKWQGLDIRTKVFDLEIDELCRVFIVHAGGGCVMDENGKILFFMLNENPNFPGLDHTLHFISISRGCLLNQIMFSIGAFGFTNFWINKDKEGPCSEGSIAIKLLYLQ